MKRSNEFIGLFLAIVGSIIALAALIVAMLNWLSPFDPVGPSPIIINNQQNPSSPSNNEPNAQPMVVVVTATSPVVVNLTTVPQSTNVIYDGWVICWHGRDGYEYLIAYPENEAKQGLSLVFNLINAQGDEIQVVNDSLKMCYLNGEWFGRPDPNEYFPTVSYLRLLDQAILVCSESPCQVAQWTLLPEKYDAWNAPELEEPIEAGVHILAYKPTR